MTENEPKRMTASDERKGFTARDDGYEMNSPHKAGLWEMIKPPPQPTKILYNNKRVFLVDYVLARANTNHNGLGGKEAAIEAEKAWNFIKGNSSDDGLTE